MTEFYKSIPEGIREKLSEYILKYAATPKLPLTERTMISDFFTWGETPEGFDFWELHHLNNTFPIFSHEQNRFINP